MNVGTPTPNVTFNQTSPLTGDEVKSSSKSGFSDGSSELSQGKKNKMVPANSEVRYYGRGKLRESELQAAYV